MSSRYHGQDPTDVYYSYPKHQAGQYTHEQPLPDTDYGMPSPVFGKVFLKLIHLYVGAVPFPKPQRNSARPPQPYFRPSPTVSNWIEDPDRYELQHPPPTISYSEIRQSYQAERSDTSNSSSSTFSQSRGQPHSGGDYTATDAQLEHQDWNAAGHDEHDYGPRVPPGNLPVFAHCSKQCT